MDGDRLTFQFAGGPVGYFEADEHPQQPSIYPYIPYRSVFHLRMQEPLKQHGFADCFLSVDGQECRLRVINYLSYGRLELALFSRLNDGEA